ASADHAAAELPGIAVAPDHVDAVWVHPLPNRQPGLELVAGDEARLRGDELVERDVPEEAELALRDPRRVCVERHAAERSRRAEPPRQRPQTLFVGERRRRERRRGAVLVEPPRQARCDVADGLDDPAYERV